MFAVVIVCTHGLFWRQSYDRLSPASRCKVITDLNKNKTIWIIANINCLEYYMTSAYSICKRTWTPTSNDRFQSENESSFIIFMWTVVNTSQELKHLLNLKLISQLLAHCYLLLLFNIEKSPRTKLPSHKLNHNKIKLKN